MSFLSLYHPAGWIVSNNDIHVLGLQENQFGLYHCVLRDGATNDVWVVKKSINLEDLYFTDVIDYYRSNIIIGFSAAIAFFLGAIITVVTYSKLSSSADTGSVMPIVDKSYTNFAMEPEVTMEMKIGSTKYFDENSGSTPL